VTVLSIVRAAWWLLAARACLVFWPGRALAWRTGTVRPEKAPGETAEQLALAVQRTARRLPFRPTCLEQALALERLLHAAGLDAAVVLGVRRVGRALDAHAWIEHQGQILLGATPAGLYSPLHRTTQT
jgi:hypothetical protein